MVDKLTKQLKLDSFVSHLNYTIVVNNVAMQGYHRQFDTRDELDVSAAGACKICFE